MTTFQKTLQKFLVYFFTSVSVLVVVLGVQRVRQGDTVTLSPETTGQGGNTEDKRLTQTPSNTATTVVAGQTITANGKAYQTPWGALTTTIKVKDGKVVAVEIPRLPDSPPSIYAEPYLIDQAIRAGSANIQGVTGATITSRAFKASLESALASAASQGATTMPLSKSFTGTTDNTQSENSTSALDIATLPTNTQSITQPAQGTQSGVSGTFIGSAYQTPWGNAVATATFTNGKITAVAMPQVPNSPPSIQAKSYLISQALAAGSANIQGVSGATYVSIAFKSSLESAITKAGTQGTIATPTPAAPSATQTTKPTVTRTYHDDDEDDDWDEEEWDD